MTMAILSPPRTSTTGRAPVLSATMRFWIRVESLNRPPTLLTMASSFNSSSMMVPLPMALHNCLQLGDCRIQVVVDDVILVLARTVQFTPGVDEAFLKRSLIFGAAFAKALLVHFPRGSVQEH